jgi:hypothetical protein
MSKTWNCENKATPETDLMAVESARRPGTHAGLKVTAALLMCICLAQTGAFSQSDELDGARDNRTPWSAQHW